MSELFNDPTEAEMVAAEILRTGKHVYMGTVLPVTARLPVHLVASIDAFVEASGTSRNHMFTRLISVGIESVLSNLPADKKDYFVALGEKKVAELIHKEAS